MPLGSKVTVKVEGLKELEEGLSELPKATGKNTIRRALTNAAQTMAQEATTLVPRRSGKLQESIQVGKVKFSSGSAGKAAFAAAMAAGATRKEAAQAAHEANIGSQEDITSGLVVFGPTRFYGAFQEFGTIHNPPHPFMRPAWDAGKATAAQTIRDELKSEIEKAAARIARKALKAAK